MALIVPMGVQRWRDQGHTRQAVQDVAEAGPVTEPAMLLHPSLGVVPFWGRAAVLDDLLAWCRDGEAEPVRLLVGLGGVGKSRLAIELLDKLGRGWKTITVRKDREENVMPGCETLRSRRVLLVLDYAETRSRVALSSFLEDVAATNKHLRVLLIARNSGNWWTDIAHGSARVRQIVATATVIDLTEHESPGPDEQLIQEAMVHFARRLDVPKPTNVTFESMGRKENRILDLHAAALTAVLDSAQHRSSAPPAATTEGVVDRLLGHERRYWAQSADANPQLTGLNKPEQAIAGCTLLGARTQAEAQEAAARLPIGTADAAAVAAWFRSLYPPDDPEEAWWGALRPDRLAEVHVVRQLIDSEPLRRACLHNLDDLQVRQVYTLLAHAAAEEPDAATLLEQYLGPILDTDIPSWRTLHAILAALPTQPVRLAKLGVRLSRALLAATPMDDYVTRAQILGNLGGWLGNAGDLVCAEETTRQAISHYHALRRPERDKHQDGLALCYANLSVELTHQQLHLEAQQAAHSAISIYRRLADEDPTQYAPELSRTLNSLVKALSEAGWYSEVIPYARQIQEIFRKLADISPEQYLPELASASVNLGHFLGEVGSHEKALGYAELAVDLYQQLADAYPHRYKSGLALALNNMGNHLGELGRYGEAIPYTEKALQIRRELANLQPDRYREDLALSLNNLGYYNGMIGGHENALKYSEEAVKLRRTLAVADPERHMSDLARSLTNIINHLHALGRPEDSLPLTKEVLEIRWDLFHVHGERFRSDLFASFENFARNLSALGKEPAAQAIYREARQFQPNLFDWDALLREEYGDPKVLEWLAGMPLADGTE